MPARDEWSSDTETPRALSTAWITPTGDPLAGLVAQDVLVAAAASGEALASGSRALRRGTFSAVVSTAAALLLTAVVVHQTGFAIRLTPWQLAGLLAAATLLERVGFLFGRRGWFVCSLGAVLAAGLMGGPVAGGLVGLVVGVADVEGVWRRRVTYGAVAVMQGVVVGLLPAVGDNAAKTALVCVAAVLLAPLISTTVRVMIALDRLGHFDSEWRKGLMLDLIEVPLLWPLLTVIMLAAPQSATVAIAAIVSLALVGTAARLTVGRISGLLAEAQLAARRDELTRLPNRRAGQELLERFQQRALRGGLPVGVCLIDLDRFKQVNTRFGQSGGDVALRAIVEQLEAALRPGDVLVRWGGEELLAFAPDVNSDSLERVAERLREAAASNAVELDGEDVTVTVSVGASLLDGMRTVPELLRACDRALLEAKQTRNAVVVVGSEPGASGQRDGRTVAASG